METRRLLYFGPHSDVDSAQTVAGLRESGWEVNTAGKPDEAVRCVDSGAFTVGVAEVNGQLWRDAAQVAASGTRMEWVAILDDDVLALPEARALVASSFYDYHTLPVDLERLRVTLGHALGMAELRRCADSPPTVDNGYNMVGDSPAMKTVFKRIARVACTDVPVLITGDSGTGKELIANAIHDNSERANKPFVAVNCSALSPGLIQSELFGHEKGSFTGAYKRRMGHFEAAAGGTVFLDEIGDLPADLQVSLLRFLEQRVITRVGNTEGVPVDVRIIAATHVDLATATREGKFRYDLYHRLNVFPLHVPRLAERQGDVELLARHFFNTYRSDRNGRVQDFSPQAIDALNRYSWPGNVRELLNRVRRGLVACEGKFILPQDMGFEDEWAPATGLRTLTAARADAERDLLVDALRYSRDNVSHAARQLGVSRVTMYRLMRKHDICID